MNYKRLAISLLFIFTSFNAYARPNPSYVGICYEFKKDQLINYDTCVVSTGNGAGVLYTTLKYNNKKYLLDNSVGQGENWSINGKKAKLYTRDPYYLERTDIEELISYDDPIIYCYENDSLNICHN